MRKSQDKKGGLLGAGIRDVNNEMCAVEAQLPISSARDWAM